LDTYASLFARKRFFRLNKFLFQLSLRGLGILNYKNETASGEEHFLRERLRGSVKPVVFDVGANRGDYSLAVLAANPGAQLFSFEPHPETFRRLSENLGQRAVQMINAACGKTKGEMVLYDHSTEGSTHASLYRDVIEELHHQQSQGQTVEVIDLDSFTNEHGIDFIDLLKLDTEGHELEVLGGAQRLLREGRVGAIQFEFNEMNVISRSFFKDFYIALPGYRLHRMLRDGLILLPEYSPTFCELFSFQNVVALLNSSSSRYR
jgi:FkbM family methyltransferase